MTKIIMPLVLRPQISPAVAAVACAHGALAGYIRWKDDAVVEQWISSVFYKRVFQPANLEMWAAVLRWPDAVVLTESQLDHLVVIAVFKPRVWSSALPFNDLALYST